MRPLSFSAAARATCAVFLGSAGVSQARLGETPEQCAIRYGKSVAETNALLPAAKSLTYVKNQVRVRVEFLHGKAVFISFTKRTLRPEERQSLLMLNSGNLRWSAQEEFLGRKFWVAREGGALEENRQAMEYMFGDVGVLEIAGQSWMDLMKAQQTTMLAGAMTSGTGEEDDAEAPAATTEDGKAADPDNPNSRVGAGVLEGF